MNWRRASFLNLSLVIASAGQGTTQEAEPFPSFRETPVPEMRLSQKVLARITHGDFVYPALSPAGKVLAYSKVIARTNSESTKVLLFDLPTRRTFTLLLSRAADRYATYKAFVGKWRG